MDVENTAPVDGSERRLPPSSRRIGEVDPNDRFDVSVLVRRKAELDRSMVDRAPSDSTPTARRSLRAGFADAYGASSEDLAAVAAFAAAAGLSVVTSDAARRTIVLRGSSADQQKAFGVQLATYSVGGHQFRGREGHAHVPTELAGIVTAVLGLDDRPQAHAHFHTGATIREQDLPSPNDDPGHPVHAMAAAGAPPVAVPLWTTRVARLYDFPTVSTAGTALDGAGQTIGIIELGGGFRADDLTAYFRKAGVPEPTVTAVPVGTGANTPGGAADGEVLLDIEVAGTVAPAAKIAVYFAEGADDRGFLDALTTAVHDPVRAPPIISISWGGPESTWTAQALTEFENALEDAAALDVTVIVAAGDHGAGDGAGDGQRHADFPASSPHVLACGGTTLVATPTGIASEVVWNDHNGWAGGGGISRSFGRPVFQDDLTAAALPGDASDGRGVPDVAANADIASGYIVRVDRKWTPIGGTSAVAPLWAGLVARLNQGKGHPVGYLNPTLYRLSAQQQIFRDVISGDNSVPATQQWGPTVKGYTARLGWDPASGLGAVRGDLLLSAIP